MGNKFLSAKAGVHTHQTYKVYVVKDVFQQRNRSVWIDSNACLHSERLNLLNIPVKVITYFKMDSKYICTCGFKCLCIFFRLKNHQMNIVDLIIGLSDLLDNR